MSSKPLNSANLATTSGLIDLAIESIQSRGGAEPPKGPRPVQDASNELAIKLLKQSIERTQANIDNSRAAVFAAEAALREARIVAMGLHSQEEKELRSLYLIAKASGYTSEQITALMHEMNTDCDEDGCTACQSKYREMK